MGAKRLTLTTTNAHITGSFHSNERISLVSRNGEIYADVELFSNADSKKLAKLEMFTTNG